MHRGQGKSREWLMYEYKNWKKENFKRMTSSSKAHVARRQEKLCDMFAPGAKPVTQKQKRLATAKRKQLSIERRKKLLAATRKRLAAEGRKELSNDRRKNAARF